jgi:hypothetical protein
MELVQLSQRQHERQPGISAVFAVGVGGAATVGNEIRELECLDEVSTKGIAVVTGWTWSVLIYKLFYFIHFIEIHIFKIFHTLLLLNVLSH